MNGIKIYSSSGTEANIDIEGYIGSRWWEDQDKQNTLARIKKDIDAIKSLSTNVITVNIHSLGGDADHALAIHDALKEHSAKIITKITGMCASAATVIFMAGDERKMSDNALLLIHKCSTHAFGNENEFEAELQTMRTLNERMLAIYLRPQKANKEELQALMNENNGNGKWITAQEAETLGLVTEVYKPAGNRKVAAFSKEMFRKTHLPDLPQGYDFMVEPSGEKSFFAEFFAELKEELKDLFSINYKPTNTQISMKNTFPLITALFALGDDVQFDKEIGFVCNEEKFKLLESELATITALQAKISEKETKIATLQALIDKMPAPSPQANGDDSDDDSVETFADRMSKKSFYQAAAAELGKQLNSKS